MSNKLSIIHAIIISQIDNKVYIIKSLLAHKISYIILFMIVLHAFLLLKKIQEDNFVKYKLIGKTNLLMRKILILAK